MMENPEKPQEILVRLKRCAVQIMCMTTNFEAHYEYDVYQAKVIFDHRCCFILTGLCFYSRDEF